MQLNTTYRGRLGKSDELLKRSLPEREMKSISNVTDKIKKLIIYTLFANVEKGTLTSTNRFGHPAL